MLYVDVNIGPDKSERIVVFEGDTAEDLASSFCEEWSLSEVMREKLTELL
jgi:hypothetical protein